MSGTSVEMQGTVRRDGTLVLDEKVPLPPGRVRVLIEPLSLVSVPRENWWLYLQNSRAALEATGHSFLNPEELAAYLTGLRSGDERLEAVSRRTGGQ